MVNVERAVGAVWLGCAGIFKVVVVVLVSVWPTVATRCCCNQVAYKGLTFAARILPKAQLIEMRALRLILLCRARRAFPLVDEQSGTQCVGLQCIACALSARFLWNARGALVRGGCLVRPGRAGAAGALGCCRAFKELSRTAVGLRGARSDPVVGIGLVKLLHRRRGK